ncbi:MULTISPECIES: hypothetical protein [Sphingomonas]|uniref:hypothetical protein n=1 Tax=Sphingomonas TaxID=13687 RepID=UPI002550B946|nr:MULTISPECIES: hypothetical protein [Sphingomonas]MDK8186697.1 hypothetical protein [Sphingomonas zeae]MDK8216362.1 hypothetical protein [Sphingomonas sp. UMB7805-LC452B]
MAVVIFGPPATGKTFHADRFAKHYGCNRVLDEGMDGRRVEGPLGRHDLVLTTDGRDTLRQRFVGLGLCTNIMFIAIEDARHALSLGPVPDGGFSGQSYYFSLVRELQDAEAWFGPHGSREAAATAARAKTDEGFWTATARPVSHDLDIFDMDMVQEKGAIADAFDAANGQNLGDDGESGPMWWDEDAAQQLIDRLNATFTAWAKEHGYERGWALDTNDEQWHGPNVPARVAPAPPAPEPAGDRQRSILSLFSVRS